MNEIIRVCVETATLDLFYSRVKFLKGLSKTKFTVKVTEIINVV